jgi:arsenate reductase (glutaredoxin)
VSVVIYGIPNCDKIKRTLAWFDAHRVPYCFHNYRKDGLDAARLKHWLAQLEWTDLLNRAGTTWRGLPDRVKNGVADTRAAQRLMLKFPTLVRRPVIEANGQVHVGYDETAFRDLAKR